MNLSQFGHGQSNPTYMISTPSQKYVLRKQPPGDIVSKTAHRIDREYRIMHALSKSDVPVPKTYCLCEDESVAGKAFYICECIEGRVFKDVSLPDLRPEDRSRCWLELMEVMAAMHNVDFRSVGLEGYGKSSGYFQRQTKTLSEVARAQRAVSKEV